MDSEVTSVETWQTTEADRHFGTLLEAVRRGEWQLVRENGRADVVLADAQEIGDLLGVGFRFRPTNTFDGQRVEIWLPEVETHVVGATLEDARRELSESMIKYAAEWEQRGRQTAYQSLKAGYVRRIQLAGDQKGVLAMLDRDAQFDSANDSRSPALGSAEPDPDLPRRWMGPRDRINRLRDAQANRKP
jgi:hypothetical protein